MVVGKSDVCIWISGALNDSFWKPSKKQKLPENPTVLFFLFFFLLVFKNKLTAA